MAPALNAAQADAVTADENLLVCACPGSGKTRVLVEKVRHVLASRPEARIITATFSRDAAEEMAERIGAAVPALSREELARRVVIGTFHGLAMRQLKEAGVARRMLTGIELHFVVRRALELSAADIPPAEAEAVIYALKADPAYRESHRRHAALADAYRRELAARQAADFADLLLEANDRMARGVLAPIAATHVFTDEMQDIDALQYRWLMHHLGGGRVACAVGDDDQSIYGFRAALGYRGMMDFQADTNARIITLETNYRSTPEILASASRLIQVNMDRVAKRPRAHRPAGAAPRVLAAGDTGEQALDIIAALDGLCAGNEVPPARPGARPYRFGVRRGQAAVLARTNRRLHDVERVFRAHRVPYLRTGASIWDTQPAQVFVALLQSLHARSGGGIEVALRWAGVADRRVRALAQACGGDLWRVFADGPRLPVHCGPEAAKLALYGSKWADALAGDYGAHAAEGVIGGVAGWMEQVMRRACDDNEAGLAGGPEPTMLWAVESVRDALVDIRGKLPVRIGIARMEGEQHVPRVVLSTFHAAKGREWDHVFLTDVQTGVVPKVGDAAGDTELEEERRCFYVAMTRARDSLTIYTGARKAAVSEFIHDAGLTPPGAGPAAQGA